MKHPDGFFTDDKGATAVSVWVNNPKEEHHRLYTVIQNTCYTPQRKKKKKLRLTGWTWKVLGYHHIKACLNAFTMYHSTRQGKKKNWWKPRSFVAPLSLSWRTVISADDGSLHAETSFLSSASCLLSFQTHRNHQWTKRLILRFSFSSEIMLLMKNDSKTPFAETKPHYFFFFVLSLWSLRWQWLAC